MTRTSELDDVASLDVDSLITGGDETGTASFVTSTPLATSYIGVPRYCDRSTQQAFRAWSCKKLPQCQILSLGDLIDKKWLVVRPGHGSPSRDMRSGTIPYIKVSDIRNGTINPNSTNVVSDIVAKKLWKTDISGISSWDVVTPARASKNIGEPAMVLPGQEKSVFTKEVLIFSATADAPFDNFFIAWALMLSSVNVQWNRVISMQTNREDLGDRWREILIPEPPNKGESELLSKSTRDYYEGQSKLRKEYQIKLAEWK